MFAFVKKEKKRVNFKRLSVNTIGCLSNAKSENGSKQRDRQDLFPCETTCRELSFRRKYSSKGVYKITGEPVRPLSTGFPRFSNVTGEDIAPRSRSIDSTLPRSRRRTGRGEEAAYILGRFGLESGPSFTPLWQLFRFDCRFCVGDRFYLCENKILCEFDYEERLAFANMSVQTPATLAYIKRQLPPAPTPPGQNMHPGHNPLQPHQGLGQSVGQHNHVSNVS